MITDTATAPRPPCARATRGALANPTTELLVRVSRACMPSRCWGTYYRVAVLAVDPGVASVTQISARARGVRSVVATWERCSGRTGGPRTAYARAVAAAEALIDDLTARCDEGVTS